MTEAIVREGRCSAERVASQVLATLSVGGGGQEERNVGRGGGMDEVDFSEPERPATLRDVTACMQEYAAADLDATYYGVPTKWGLPNRSPASFVSRPRQVPTEKIVLHTTSSWDFSACPDGPSTAGNCRPEPNAFPDVGRDMSGVPVSGVRVSQLHEAARVFLAYTLGISVESVQRMADADEILSVQGGRRSAAIGYLASWIDKHGAFIDGTIPVNVYELPFSAGVSACEDLPMPPLISGLELPNLCRSVTTTGRCARDSSLRDIMNNVYSSVEQAALEHGCAGIADRSKRLELRPANSSTFEAGSERALGWESVGVEAAGSGDHGTVAVSTPQVGGGVDLVDGLVLEMARRVLGSDERYGGCAEYEMGFRKTLATVQTFGFKGVSEKEKEEATKIMLEQYLITDPAVVAGGRVAARAHVRSVFEMIDSLHGKPRTQAAIWCLLLRDPRAIAPACVALQGLLRTNPSGDAGSALVVICLIMIHK